MDNSINTVISSRAVEESTEGSTTRSDSQCLDIKIMDNNDHVVPSTVTMVSYVYVYLDLRRPGRFSYKNLPMSFLFEPFYVGKGTGSRYIMHLVLALDSSWTRSYKDNKIRAIYKSTNSRDFIVKVVEDLTDRDACNTEIQFIQAIGRLDLGTGPLTNLTGGGDGHLNPSKEVRAKISASLKGNKRALGLKMMEHEGFRKAHIGNQWAKKCIGMTKDFGLLKCLLCNEDMKRHNMVFAAHFKKVHNIIDFNIIKQNIKVLS
jgi:hypothetical protein